MSLIIGQAIGIAFTAVATPVVSEFVQVDSTGGFILVDITGGFILVG